MIKNNNMNNHWRTRERRLPPCPQCPACTHSPCRASSRTHACSAYYPVHAQVLSCSARTSTAPAGRGGLEGLDAAGAALDVLGVEVPARRVAGCSTCSRGQAQAPARARTPGSTTREGTLATGCAWVRVGARGCAWVRVGARACSRAGGSRCVRAPRSASARAWNGVTTGQPRGALPRPHNATAGGGSRLSGGGVVWWGAHARSSPCPGAHGQKSTASRACRDDGSVQPVP